MLVDYLLAQAKLTRKTMDPYENRSHSFRFRALCLLKFVSLSIKDLTARLLYFRSSYNA